MTIIMVMKDSRRYTITYADEIYEHLQAMEPEHYSLIESEVEAQLAFQPLVETRNRKPLKRPVSFGADWELRLGPGNRFRVFYEVDTNVRIVRVLAIGVKDRKRLQIGGEEFNE